MGLRTNAMARMLISAINKSLFNAVSVVSNYLTELIASRFILVTQNLQNHFVTSLGLRVVMYCPITGR